MPGVSHPSGQPAGRFEAHRDKELVREFHPVADAVGAVSLPEFAPVQEQPRFPVTESLPERELGGLDDLRPVFEEEARVAGPINVGLQCEEQDAVLVEFALLPGPEPAGIPCRSFLADEFSQEPVEDCPCGAELAGHGQGHGDEGLVPDPLEVVLPYPPVELPGLGDGGPEPELRRTEKPVEPGIGKQGGRGFRPVSRFSRVDPGACNRRQLDGGFAVAADDPVFEDNRCLSYPPEGQAFFGGPVFEARPDAHARPHGFEMSHGDLPGEARRSAVGAEEQLADAEPVAPPDDFDRGNGAAGQPAGPEGFRAGLMNRAAPQDRHLRPLQARNTVERQRPALGAQMVRVRDE